MPSTKPLPTITQLRKAAADALRGQIDRYGDKHDGAIYDHIAGPYALLMAREAAADRDVFRAIYFDDALDDDLTERGLLQYGVARILDTYGQGTTKLARPAATAGDGTIYQGTRVQIQGTSPAIYEVASDTPVTGLSATVPIQAMTVGVGTAANVSGGLAFLDPIYDLTWTPIALTCADGTNFEQASDYRGRVRQTLLNSRNGYAPNASRSSTAMLTGLRAAGASFAIFFASTYGLGTNDFDDDCGLNAVYVADPNYQSSPALIQACAVALEATRVLGADLWVGGIAQSILQVSAVVSLFDSPGSLDLIPIQRAMVQALLAYFSGVGSGYVVKRAALSGAMQAAHPAVQTVTFTSPSADTALPNITSSAAAPVLGGLVQGWPATLTRFTLVPSSISLQFTGPV